MTAYAKALVAILATILSAILAAFTGDQHISGAEWINVAILAAGACAVFTAPNVPGSLYTKGILAAITAALTLGTQLLVDGTLDATDWLQLGTAVLGALAVWAVPNSGVTVIQAT